MEHSQQATHPILLMITCCLLVMVFNIDFTGTNVILPEVINSFKSTLLAGQWVNNSFAAAVAISFLVGTRICMIYGLRATATISMLIYPFACYGCAVSNQLSTLIFFRCIMGLSIGFSYMAVLLMVLEAFPENKKGLAMGMIFGSMGLGMLAGPSVSTWITEGGLWQHLYLANIPCALLLLIGFYLFTPKQKLLKISLNLPGIILCSLATLLLFISSNNLSQGMLQWYNWLLLALGLLCILTIIHWERKQKVPLVPLDVFKVKSFLSGVYLRLVGQIYFIIALTAIPLYLYNILNLPMLSIGYAMTIMTATIAIGSPLFGRLLDRIGASKVNLLSLILCLIFSLIFLLLNDQHLNHSLFILLLILAGLLTAANFTATSLSPLRDVAPQQKNQTLGLVFTFAMFGDVIGLMMFSCIMQYLASHWSSNMQSFFDKLRFTSHQREIAVNAATGILNKAHLKTHFNTMQMQQLLPEINRQVLLELKAIFGFCAVLAIIALYCNYKTRLKSKQPS